MDVILCQKYKIGSDFNFFVKVFSSRFKKKYADLVIANMLDGGISSKSIIKLLDEKLIIIRENYPYKFYYSSYLYQYVIERPRIIIKDILVRLRIIGVWRLIKLKINL